MHASLMTALACDNSLRGHGAGAGCALTSPLIARSRSHPGEENVSRRGGDLVAAAAQLLSARCWFLGLNVSQGRSSDRSKHGKKCYRSTARTTRNYGDSSCETDLPFRRHDGAFLSVHIQPLARRKRRLKHRGLWFRH
ncbi:hypothetical protein HZ326_24494 [Fusarium oxysporum f. sp. albedinis]|nr:hypothetical protein HZ326_24494 [Fusarium oxysporum f. sp. albedinis]